MQPEGQEDRQSPWEMFDDDTSLDSMRNESSSVNDDVIARCLDVVQRLRELPRFQIFSQTPKPTQMYQSASGIFGLVWPW